MNTKRTGAPVADNDRSASPSTTGKVYDVRHNRPAWASSDDSGSGAPEAPGHRPVAVEPRPLATMPLGTSPRPVFVPPDPDGHAPPWAYDYSEGDDYAGRADTVFVLLRRTDRPAMPAIILALREWGGESVYLHDQDNDCGGAVNGAFCAGAAA